jgi:DNA-binding NarL/FixJ family response regulator
MKIHIFTTNTYLRQGVIALGKDNDIIINSIQHEAEKSLIDIDVNDLVIFHVSKSDPSLLLRILTLSRRTKILLICSQELRLDMMYNAIQTVDEKSSLATLLSTITKIGNKGANYHERYVYFSGREWEVLTGIIKGVSVNTIAKQLGISPKTVYAHKSNAYKKLGAKNIHDIFPFKNIFYGQNKYNKWYKMMISRPSK